MAGIASRLPPLPDEVSVVLCPPRTAPPPPPPDPPFRSMPRSPDLCYARQGSQYTIRSYQANTGFLRARLPLPLSSTSPRFSTRKSYGRRPRIRVSSRESRHRGGKKCPLKGGGREGGSSARSWVGGMRRGRREGGREVSAGERGMRGSVSACT